MSIESRSQRHRPNPRRDLVVAAALAAFAVLTAVVVALWPGESWRDQAIAGVFPAPPVSGWDASTSADPSAAGAGATEGAPTATVVPARATPSVVPTRTAPRPAPPATSPRATSQAPATTPAPSPTSTNGKGRHKPKPPTGKPSPTTTQNDSGCLLGVIC
ncbi:hypothetical protein ACWEOW_01365 [Monashia sp. NPDC004114]